ncbi:hypothetical protein ACGF13_31060 [Kitasatospora sp. NPDC048286]|uniref:hypothetical protein n=1 Tax=Kitasatospora sp. NPDC048286 TaxID=3364047 RepID=UPI00371A3B79
MSITRKIAVAAMGAVMLSGAVVGTSSVATAADTVGFWARAQNEADDTNLAYTSTWAVVTQKPGATSLEGWYFTKVDETTEGTGIYTIEGDNSRNCVTDKGTGQDVRLEPCEPGKLTQQWVVDTGQEHTTIASRKNLNEVLTAEGVGKNVKLVQTYGKPSLNQLWTLIYF